MQDVARTAVREYIDRTSAGCFSPRSCARRRQRSARHHALVDGNKRLSLATTIAFYGMNGIRLTFTNDGAYDFVIAVATGELDDVLSIAAVLRSNHAST